MGTSIAPYFSLSVRERSARALNLGIYVRWAAANHRFRPSRGELELEIPRSRRSVVRAGGRVSVRAYAGRGVDSPAE